MARNGMQYRIGIMRWTVLRAPFVPHSVPYRALFRTVLHAPRPRTVVHAVVTQEWPAVYTNCGMEHGILCRRTVLRFVLTPSVPHYRTVDTAKQYGTEYGATHHSSVGSGACAWLRRRLAATRELLVSSCYILPFPCEYSPAHDEITVHKRHRDGDNGEVHSEEVRISEPERRLR